MSDVVPVDRSSVPCRLEDCYLEELDGELLLLHPGQNKSLYLNESASMIWQLCDGQRTVGEMVDLLGSAYPEDAAGIEDEVGQAVREFVREGIVFLK